MPIPIEKIQVVEHEFQRQHDSDDESDDDQNQRQHHYQIRHTTAMTPPEQDFSFLKNHGQAKRSVHYDIEQIDSYETRPLRIAHENEQQFDNVLRRRYIAHWGLPEWLGDNHFLLQKHRPPANSVRECLISIASIHSETVNIWTHLIGALCVAVTFVLFLIDNHRQMDISDFISFSVFFISAILCLTFSTLLHVFINYSPRVMVIVSKLDYMGISILIFGSMIPVIHYLFYCNLKLKTIYIGILLGLSIASVIGTSSAACAKPRCRPFKAILFIALGLYGAAPATHACILHGFPRMFQMGFLYLVIMAVTYISGGVIYAVRIPERFFPGRFDIIGHSHQILHIAVIAAVYLHFYGICCLFNTVIRTEQCIMPITLKLGVTDLSISSTAIE
ncbi:unnamed protein product [Rotaria magnacalcarata]|uniref:Uncharacterized protein n=3 Tax=Rotaria magnacalcarata TaxID=392030 RepID=A0A814R093_9BILA|nr:unnamed protein product [Rotaria magnacalcarata]CAF1309590.1 unnamed protein product [Rotaria magnacalcarata]CAF2058178.1 unnamed protein product [Rotaria magnacalcarata]CAF2166113.1 unnamed protein product [Rotaria magnacalcarata]CAF2211283.1 unnamed protein product [Rotaria magnacalcarata]